MSERTHQTLSNLTDEVTQAAAEQLALYQRLHQVAPNLISAHDVHLVEQRLQRLRRHHDGHRLDQEQVQAPAQNARSTAL